MTTLAQKIRWSGSAFRLLPETLFPVLMVMVLSACSHAPVRDTNTLGSVRFTVEAPGAEHVDLVLLRGRTEDPGMVKIQARSMAGDLWSVEMDLIPGEYRYFFLVDGTVKVNDGPNRVEEDDFGGVTGVLRVFRDLNGEIQAY